jgi:DNA-binding beta-propeller fold protein YncE
MNVCRLLSLLMLSGLPAVVTGQDSLKADASEPPALESRFRRPSSIALSNDGKLLAVANRNSGSITLLDADSGAIQSETKIGMELSDIAALPDPSQFLVTDFANHELILLSVEDSLLTVTRRIPVARFPAAIEVSPDGNSIAVASFWSRRLSVGKLSSGKEATSKAASETGNLKPASFAPKVVDLPFVPGCLAFENDGSIIISEAFGGRIAVFEIGSSVLRTHEMPVHNIRDLVIREGRVWFSHQLLRETARTEAEHIHWGVLLENFVSSLEAGTLHEDSRPAASPLRLEQVRIGDAGDGAGDPSGIAVLSDRIAVTLAGTAQLALIDRVGVRETRLATKARPVKLVCDEVRQRAFIVNSLSDSVTIVDLKSPGIVRTVPLGPPRKARSVERGEAAFFNAKLSLENWMSCHSCHTDGHTNNRLADTLGDGRYGNAKRVPSLLGTANTSPWGWTGSQKTLVGQLKKTFATTMHAPSRSAETAADLAAYLKSLRPAPSLSMARGPSDKALAEAGEVVFRSTGCVECHSGNQFTADRVFDVDLEDQVGLRRFNPPSLLGVSQRDRLLHDGRARSLDELLDCHPPGIALSRQQKRQLVTYLNGL